MRLRKLRDLIERLKKLQGRKKKLTRDQLLLAVGQAKEQAGRAYALLDIQWPEEGQDITAQTFTFRLNRARYRLWRRREGRYLLRTNLTTADPKMLWEYYLQLTTIEAAFKNLKDDLQIRPIFHQKEDRIEAHIFVAYLALLPARHTPGQAQADCRRTDAAQRSGEICHHTNDERPLPDGRTGQGTGLSPLHSTRKRTPDDPLTTRLGTARASATAHQPQQRIDYLNVSPPSHRVVKTF